MSDEIAPGRGEIQKLPRVKCALCGIVQAKPAMTFPALDQARCRNEVACQIRRDRAAERRRQREGNR